MTNDTARCTDISCPLSDNCLRHNLWLHAVSDGGKYVSFVEGAWDGQECYLFIQDNTKREKYF